jgi:hypothetical protein
LGGGVDMGAYEFAFEGDLRAVLAGPLTGTVMRAAPVGALATNSPYAVDTRQVSTFPSNAVDWVLVQVRTNLDSAAAFTRSYFLRTDGAVMDETGNTNLLLETSRENYLLVQHRNHLTVASPIRILTNRLFSCDFTTGPDKYLGGANAAVEAAPGVWAMIPGDADGDGELRPVDTNIWNTQAEP